MGGEGENCHKNTDTTFLNTVYINSTIVIKYGIITWDGDPDPHGSVYKNIA